jgi:hypothetical protein
VALRNDSSDSPDPTSRIPTPAYESLDNAKGTDALNEQFARRCGVIAGAALFGILNLKYNALGNTSHALIYALVIGGIAGLFGLLVALLVLAIKGRWGVLVLVVCLAIAGFGAWMTYQSTHPATVAQAQRLAVKRYPELGVPNSPLNRAFVARYKQYQATNRGYFNQPGWPLTLAEECQAELDKTPPPAP